MGVLLPITRWIAQFSYSNSKKFIHFYLTPMAINILKSLEQKFSVNKIES